MTFVEKIEKLKEAQKAYQAFLDRYHYCKITYKEYIDSAGEYADYNLEEIMETICELIVEL